MPLFWSVLKKKKKIQNKPSTQWITQNQTPTLVSLSSGQANMLTSSSVHLLVTVWANNGNCFSLHGNFVEQAKGQFAFILFEMGIFSFVTEKKKVIWSIWSVFRVFVLIKITWQLVLCHLPYKSLVSLEMKLLLWSAKSSHLEKESENRKFPKKHTWTRSRFFFFSCEVAETTCIWRCCFFFKLVSHPLPKIVYFSEWYIFWKFTEMLWS